MTYKNEKNNAHKNLAGHHKESSSVWAQLNCISILHSKNCELLKALEPSSLMIVPKIQ